MGQGPRVWVCMMVASCVCRIMLCSLGFGRVPALTSVSRARRRQPAMRASSCKGDPYLLGCFGLNMHSTFSKAQMEHGLPPRPSQRTFLRRQTTHAAPARARARGGPERCGPALSKVIGGGYCICHKARRAKLCQPDDHIRGGSKIYPRLEFDENAGLWHWK